jgi:hypothetical protein
MRMTIKILEEKVNILNLLTDKIIFILEYSCGGVRLYKNEGCGYIPLSERTTIKEMGIILDTVANTLHYIK